MIISEKSQMWSIAWGYECESHVHCYCPEEQGRNHAASNHILVRSRTKLNYQATANTMKSPYNVNKS
ncbi:hypothetical protein RSAG8_07030, partial [Rhizoctonia solani AG-8 WAC10335]